MWLYFMYLDNEVGYNDHLQRVNTLWTRAEKDTICQYHKKRKDREYVVCKQWVQDAAKYLRNLQWLAAAAKRGLDM
jgi:hypothetical protein